MDFDERALYLLLGMILGTIIGTAVGYAARMMQDIQQKVVVLYLDIQDIKEEVDEIDTIVKTRRVRDENGFMRIPLVADVVLIVVIALTFWAAWATGETNNKLEKAVSDIQAVQAADAKQDARIETISQCTLEFTSKTILALNERTRYSPGASEANADVLQAQAEFLEVVLKIPPPGDAESRAALQVYTVELDKFNKIARKNIGSQLEFAYPTNEELASCLGVSLPEVQTGEKQVK